MKPTDRLESELRRMIDEDRATLEAFYVEWIRQGVERFLELRKPNLKPYEVYGREVEPLGIMEATTYVEAANAVGYKMHEPKSRRPAFDVEFKPDADEIIARIAKREVEDMIRGFLSRALSKLGPIVERITEWKSERVANQGRFSGNRWVGMIRFEFDGLKFMTELKIIMNFSKLDKAFHQYPMTFHDVVMGDAKPCGASIEDIWKHVGYILPPPPPKKKRWTKLVKDCVVMHEGKPFLVTTLGKAKKAGIPADAEQIARLEYSHAAGWLERSDCTKEKYVFPENIKDECIRLHHDCHWDESKALERKTAWKHFFPDGHAI